MLAEKCLGKRSSFPKVETFEEEGIMEWDQYNEYFKELTKDDLDRLTLLKEQSLMDINEILSKCSPAALKLKESSKIYEPIEKIMR